MYNKLQAKAHTYSIIVSLLVESFLTFNFRTSQTLPNIIFCSKFFVNLEGLGVESIAEFIRQFLDFLVFGS